MKKSYKNNYQFIDSAIVNDKTYFDYLERFKKLAITKEIIELHNGKICAKSNDEFIEFQIELKK